MILQMHTNAQVNNLQEDKLAVCCGGSFPLHILLRRQAYPSTNYPFPNDVDEVSDFTACNNDNKMQNCQNSALIFPQNAQCIINMNAALINTLLSLIPMAFKLLYKQEWMMDPNADFCLCLHWFC